MSRLDRTVEDISAKQHELRKTRPRRRMAVVTATVPLTVTFDPDGDDPVEIPDVPVSAGVKPRVGDAVSVSSTSGGLLVEGVLNAAAATDYELHDSYAGKADGLTPVKADSGQTLSNFGTEQMEVDDGRLWSPQTAAELVACYQETELRGDVVEVGARFSFSPSSVATVALLISKTRLEDEFDPDTESYPTGLPDFPFHLGIKPDSWGLDVVTDNDPAYPSSNPLSGWESLSTGFFDTPLETDGTVYEVRAWISGDTITLKLPDGQTVIVSNAAVEANAGPFTTCEVYADDASTDGNAFIHDWWAGSDAPSPYSLYPSRTEVYGQLAATAYEAAAFAINATRIHVEEFAPASADHITVDDSTGDLLHEGDLDTLIIWPLSKKVLVTITASWVDMTAGDLYLSVASGATLYGVHLAQSGAYEGPAHVSFLLDGNISGRNEEALTPGEGVGLSAWGLISGGDAEIKADYSAGQTVSMSAVPVS